MKKTVNMIVQCLLATFFVIGFMACGSIESESTHDFSAILSAYAEFERSGFTVLDDDLISLSYFTAQNHSTGTNLGWEGRSKPRIMYAFHDMNGNGVPELFIGGTWSDRQVRPSLIAVYTLQNGAPVPLIYEWSHHVFLELHADIYGNYIIRVAGGRMGIMWDDIYGLDENGNLLELGGVYFWERYRRCECCNAYDVFYTEFYRVAGERFLGDNEVLISEDEYTALLVQWGIYDNMGRVELAWEYLIQ